LLEYSLPVIVALILTTATTEEILFRGYVIERLEELTGRLWLAVGFSFVVFVIPHIVFFGPLWLLTNGANVVLLYMLYVWRRNLIACMIMHLLGNSLLLIPALGLAG
jgi:membrane protease YdiL (CAAX protease family)